MSKANKSSTMEMIRGSQGEAVYRTCLGELFRLLRPGGLLALGEPMHFDVPIPEDLAPLMPLGDPSWEECFSTVDRTIESVQSQGFIVLEADYAPDARQWWLEFAAFDPGCRANPLEEPRAIQADGGRWLSFGYVIAQKPG